MKILVFDNYDSFTYNLVHALKSFNCAEVEVYRNDKIALDDVEKYDKIVLSPGPGIPSEAGLLLPLIKRFAPTKCILGICLGHQAIGEAFGGELTNLEDVYHGVTSNVNIIADDVLFNGLDKQIEVGRYHSWIVSNSNFPNCLEVTAVDDNGQNMAMHHKTYDVRGVQFHPESVLTPEGLKMLRNWIES
jgi:anthranilate synthase component II